MSRVSLKLSGGTYTLCSETEQQIILRLFQDILFQDENNSSPYDYSKIKIIHLQMKLCNALHTLESAYQFIQVKDQF